MSDRNYWVFCDDNCKFPAMTKEQIISAIAEATGKTPTRVDDAFITKIKEMNANSNLKFWIGTTAQFNALETKVADTLYILTDDDTVDSIEESLSALRTEINNIIDGTTAVPLSNKIVYNPTFTELSHGEITESLHGGLISFMIKTYGNELEFLDRISVIADVCTESVSSSFEGMIYVPGDGNVSKNLRLRFEPLNPGGNEFYVRLQYSRGETIGFEDVNPQTGYVLYYKHISTAI